jgi:hypothetical protein
MSNSPNNLNDWINKQAACWKGYEQVGMKMLNGREVPNCVPASKDIPNSKPKKKKTEKESADKWQRALAGILAGGIGGKLIGGTLGSIEMNADFPTSLDDFNFSRVGKEWSSGGSAAGGLLGALLGGGIGYATANDDDSKETKPKKKKTEKKAYGYSDDHYIAERYLDGGEIEGMTKEEAILYTKLLSDAAKRKNLELSFSSEGYDSDNAFDVDEAIKRLSEASDEDLSSYDNPNLPYYRYYKSPSKFFGLVSGKPINYNSLPEDVAWKAFEKAQQKNNKTQKKSSEEMSSQRSPSISDYIADVPIKCTPGLGCKRLLSDSEKAQINKAKSHFFPNLFPQNADPVSSLISDPFWAAIGKGILGASIAGGTVGLGAHLTNRDPLLHGGLAAGVGGLGAALIGYFSKSRKNKEIIDLIEDLPVGADIGDIGLYSDPKIRAALARDFQRQVMRKGLI